MNIQQQRAIKQTEESTQGRIFRLKEKSSHYLFRSRNCLLWTERMKWESLAIIAKTEADLLQKWKSKNLIS